MLVYLIIMASALLCPHSRILPFIRAQPLRYATSSRYDGMGDAYYFEYIIQLSNTRLLRTIGRLQQTIQGAQETKDCFCRRRKWRQSTGLREA